MTNTLENPLCLSCKHFDIAYGDTRHARCTKRVFSQAETWAKKSLAEFLYQMAQECEQTKYTFDDKRPHARIVTYEAFSRPNNK